MFSVFALPKGFVGHADVIQRNALRSWTLLRPTPEIILFGDDPGVADAAREFGVRHMPAVARNEFGTPLVSNVFENAARVARTDVLCYSNADIIFLDDLPTAVSKVSAWRQEFLLAGRRTNLEMPNALQFELGWQRSLLQKAVVEGTLQDGWWIDYFVFRRGFGRHMPSFAIGRPGWDNWLLYHARATRVPIVDATAVVTAIHQDHDYAHVPQGTGDHWRGPESDRNLALAGGKDCLFSLLDATHRLTPGGVRRRLSTQPLRRRVLRFASSDNPFGRTLSALRRARDLLTSRPRR